MWSEIELAFPWCCLCPKTLVSGIMCLILRPLLPLTLFVCLHQIWAEKNHTVNNIQIVSKQMTRFRVRVASEQNRFPVCSCDCHMNRKIMVVSPILGYFFKLAFMVPFCSSWLKHFQKKKSQGHCGDIVSHFSHCVIFWMSLNDVVW